MRFFAGRYLIALIAWLVALRAIVFVMNIWFAVESAQRGWAGFVIGVRGGLGLILLILGPPAIFVGFWYWRWGGGERAA